MQEVDMYFVLIPWKVEDSTKPLIKEMDKILSMMNQFQFYFSWAQDKSVGGTVYVDTNVQHTIHIVDLEGDVKWMIKENKMVIFTKTLQVKSTS